MTAPDLAPADDSHQDIDGGSSGISGRQIDIFLRLKPVPRPTNRVVCDSLENSVTFSIPRDSAAGLINNSRERYQFSFNGILTPEAKQDEVFERVARPVVVGAMEGFNGTIFAYGQTGSGKTFTITGGAERYVDRGVIPRTISCIYNELPQHTDFTFQVHVSYLEIYNDIGYDLLDPTREVQAMDDLPQVYIQEDEDQHIHFRNLSLHRAASEEEALNLLFLGDTNRTIAETPMNQASSRSHCIFTITLEARRAGSDIVRRSKLNLVDLAGSERVAKTGVDGTTLKEAKYINLSLHYLEQVIVALQERSMGLGRCHVPYRNSLMTLVLRDSLGGNCRTVMVATVSAEAQHMEESISTCRFAQRVALIRNEVSINEEIDPAAIIRRLKQEVRDLKEELLLAKGGAAERGPLTPDEMERLKLQLLAYVADGSPGCSLNLGGDMMVIRASWLIFKQLLHQHSCRVVAVDKTNSIAAGHQDPEVGKTCTSSKCSDSSTSAQQEQLRKLHLQVQQRDSELAIMLGMLKGKPGSNLAAVTAGTEVPADMVPTQSTGVPSTTGSIDNTPGPVLSALLDTNLLADRHKAFEVFRKSYRQSQVIEDNKQLLKAKYDQAKALGAAVNASKASINELRARIEQRRRQRSAACVVEGLDPVAGLADDDSQEEHAKQQIEQEKANYKASFSRLRELKAEIEHLQLLLEQSRQKLQHDFQQWLSLVARQQQHQEASRGVEQATVTGTAQQSSEQPIVSSTSIHASNSRPGSARPYGRSISGINSSSSSSSCSTRAPMHGAPAVSGNLTGSSSLKLRGEPSSSSTVTSTVASNVNRASGSSGAPDISSIAGTTSSSTLAHSLDLSLVDPKVLEAASPHLTGNPVADEDIIRFYEARAKLLQKLGQQQPQPSC